MVSSTAPQQPWIRRRSFRLCLMASLKNWDWKPGSSKLCWLPMRTRLTPSISRIFISTAVIWNGTSSVSTRGRVQNPTWRSSLRMIVSSCIQTRAQESIASDVKGSNHFTDGSCPVSFYQDGSYGSCFNVLRSKLLSVMSGGNRRDKLKGTNARDLQFFADFRRFLQIFAFRNYSISGAQIFAENHRKPQIFAENRRKPQIFAETPLSHLVCPF